MGLILYVAATPLPLIPMDKKSRDLAQVRRLLNLSARDFKAMVGGRFEKDEDDNVHLYQGVDLEPPAVHQRPCYRTPRPSVQL